MQVTRYKDAKPYEAPEHPEVHLATSGRSIDECADLVFSRLP